MRKILAVPFAAAGAAALVLSAAAPALAYTLNADGTGFVGKGEVQSALGLNNSGVQKLDVEFELTSTEVTSWTCTKVHVAGNSGNTIETVQMRSTSTEVTGILSSKARVKNQDTGWNLLGFASGGTPETTGDPVGSCPAGQSGFVFDDNVALDEAASGSELTVNGVALS